MKRDPKPSRLAIFRRRLFTGLSILSLLLCLATLALWVRSYWQLETVVHRPDKTWMVQSDDGRPVVLDYRPYPFLEERPRFEYTSDFRYYFDFGAARRYALSSAHFLGFGYLVTHSSPGSIRAVIFPHWFLALLFAILPGLCLCAAIRSRRRNRVGLCRICGYDLRAAPERCPECGSAAPRDNRTET